MTSNTGGNRTNKGQFRKGDPRINRKGRPKSFDALRELARQIAHEPATDKNGGHIVISGRKVTVTEAILRQWASSKNAKLQQGFLEIAFGKVPDKTELTGKDGGPLALEAGLRIPKEQYERSMEALDRAIRSSGMGADSSGQDAVGAAE